MGLASSCASSTARLFHRLIEIEIARPEDPRHLEDTRLAPSVEPCYIVAVDSGGTFTDCVVLDDRGTVTRAKAPSTPPRFEEGVLAAITEAARRLDLSLDACSPTRSFSRTAPLSRRTPDHAHRSEDGAPDDKGHEDAILIGRTVQKVAGLSEAEIIDVAQLTKADPLVAALPHLRHRRAHRPGGRVVAPLDTERLGALRERCTPKGSSRSR